MNPKFKLDGLQKEPTDTYLSDIWVEQLPEAEKVFCKRSAFRLDDSTIAIVDFLDLLKQNTHNNLLTPTMYSGSLGTFLEERYSHIDDLLLADAIHSIRQGIKQGALDVDDLINIMIQLSEGIAHIHKLGFIHGDVRANNAFIRANNDLQVTLFDYNCVRRPYFQKQGIDSWNLERPPELSDGYFWVDGKYDVYGLGYIFRSLTHEYDFKEGFKPIINSDHPIIEIIKQAMAPYDQRFKDASALLAKLSSI